MGTWKPFKPIKGDRAGKIRPHLPPAPAGGKRGPILTKFHRGYFSPQAKLITNVT